MVTYRRVWDALTSPGEADELHAQSQLLRALQQLIVDHGWSAEEAGQHLQLSAARAGRLIAGDINEFGLAELRTLAAAAPASSPPSPTAPSS